MLEAKEIIKEIEIVEIGESSHIKDFHKTLNKK